MLANDIVYSHDLLKNCILSSGKILTCGNGGSISDAEHIVGDLMKGFRLRRRITSSQQDIFRKAYPEKAQIFVENLQQAIPAISLVNSISLSTAFADDVGPEFVFAQQVFGLGRPGDVLIVISTSGNSKNVVLAAQVARAINLKVISLTGEDGGKLSEYSDVVLKAPSGNVNTIQEYHMPIYHCICAMLEDSLFGEDGKVKNIEIRDSKRGNSVKSLKHVQLVVFDFDGVFTDNKVYTSQQGIESVACDRRDSLGCSILKKLGVNLFILSTEANPVVLKRAEKIGIDAEMACRDKKQFIQKYLDKHAFNPANVAYMGNDLNDLEAMALVGHRVVPADAHPLLLKNASLILTKNGGEGAVRELCEMITAQKKGGPECMYSS